ncbi:histidine kinase [Nocardioides sp. C4-1]|uniref:sensor histidine kinase n=1 Tax=Nocardioides sp. C4-1 TaxID=3151851 RepID=UPI0032635048
MTSPPSPTPVGRLGPFFAAIWLFFLVTPLHDAWTRDDQLQRWTGLVATLAFAAVYMTLWVRARADRARLVEAPPLRWSAAYVVALVVLGGVMIAVLGESGLTSVVYVGVALVMVFPLRVAGPVIVALVVVTIGLGAVEGWGSQVGTAFGLLAASVAVFGLRTVLSRNIELLRAHEENARLAVDSERSRFARDLHDILGHSLTVITVKAELAGRLMDVDHDRARQEVADLERLSRDALADVRRAVEGYRELTLPGELAKARSALEAAGIAADLPNSTDDVPSDLRELFAWTVREGVTNVVRHSGASRCVVVLDATSAEVRDDGCGSATGPGSGLQGLRERAAAVGATLVVRDLAPGFSLRVVHHP